MEPAKPEEQAEQDPQQTKAAVEVHIKKLLQNPNLSPQDRKQLEGQLTLMGTHKFWDEQPVYKWGEPIPEKDGIIKKVKDIGLPSESP